MAKEILLFGYNRIAYEVAASLKSRGYDFLIVARDEETKAEALLQGFDAISLDVTDDEELQKVGVGRQVKKIFSLFIDDADNIFLTISARALDPEVMIVSVSQTHDTIHKLHAAGANKVIDPYEVSGRKIFEQIQKPDVVNMMDQTIFGDEDISIAEVTIPEDSFIEGKSIGWFLEQDYDLLTIGVVDKELGDEFIFIAEGKKHNLNHQDILVVLGRNEAIAKLKSDLEKPHQTSP